MRLLTAEEMRAADNHAINKVGIPGLVLMENAGIKSLMTIEKLLGGLKGKRFTIVCGKGNNGGDGLVIARHLFNNDLAVHLFIATNRENLSPDAAANLEMLENSGFHPVFITEAKDIDRLRIAMEFSECVIDCLYGTGVKGNIEGFHAELITAMNDTRAKKISIDIPSGLCSTSGCVSSPSFCADFTIALGAPKLGMFLLPGKKYCGEVWVADIGLPAMSTASVKAGHFLITTELVRALIPVRDEFMHKGDAGKLLIIAGSKQYQGAGIISSYGALRSGAGLVTLALPSCLENSFSCQILPEIILRFMPSDDTGHVLDNNQVSELASSYSVLLLGPGLGRNCERAESVRNILNDWRGTVVLDADALNLIESADQLKNCPGKVIITPHIGEMSRLTRKSVEEVKKDQIAIARNFAQDNCIHVILKSAITIIADPRGQVFINSRPNSGLARGGSGDLLAGMVTGLVATGAKALNASISGVAIISDAAELAKNELGTDSMTVSEIASFIPAAFKHLRNPDKE